MSYTLPAWANRPASSSPLNATNLNLFNAAINDLDARVSVVNTGTTIQTSEALAAGDLVNVWNSSGARVRKADASVAGKEAHGFVLSGSASGTNATVYFGGVNTAVTDLIPGMQFLSATTPGASTSTSPSGSGQTVQRVGAATSATSLSFTPGGPITLA